MGYSFQRPVVRGLTAVRFELSPPLLKRVLLTKLLAWFIHLTWLISHGTHYCLFFVLTDVEVFWCFAITNYLLPIYPPHPEVVEDIFTAADCTLLRELLGVVPRVSHSVLLTAIQPKHTCVRPSWKVEYATCCACFPSQFCACFLTSSIVS